MIWDMGCIGEEFWLSETANKEERIEFRLSTLWGVGRDEDISVLETGTSDLSTGSEGGMVLKKGEGCSSAWEKAA